MIRYRLVCDQKHEFEAWFRDGKAYEEQSAVKEVVCPRCGSIDVAKTLMTPNVSTSRAKAERVVGGTAALPNMVEMARKLREQVVRNADYVGDKFPEEARKIHYEEVEPRGIYGEATARDAKELSEEGVQFHPLPSVPEDKN